MDKIYDQTKVEDKWYKFWEESGFFMPEINPNGKPYSIILPPPNANADLHFGHAMYVVEDVLIRYHRMKGFSALWLPGSDHAGFETQVVFERNLAKEGKSRFDYDKDTLYQMIWDYVQMNKSNMENQLRKLGFSVDWTREKFTLDPDIIKVVYKTFKKMFDEGLIYRAKRLVNYCTKHGTGFSDLEVVYEDRISSLYYIKYGPLTLATTRPETKFGDTAIAVHPNDKRYKKYLGQEIEIETVLGKAKLQVIADESVDPEFGTGVVKITPAHDFNDFETGKRHNLQMKQVINFDGRLNEHAGKFAGMKVMEARTAIVEEMQRKGLIQKIDEAYQNRVGVCYKCGTVLEPLPLEQWYINVQTLKDQAVEKVKNGEIKIFPRIFETHYFQWMENLRDWNISRQNIWGIKIPIWYQASGHESEIIVTFLDADKISHTGSLNELLEQGVSFEEIEKGLQKIRVPISESESDQPKMIFSEDRPREGRWLQETDTFDTWFSSGQWPYATLMTTKPDDYEKFYPTSVMETGYDILKAWVSRMVLFGLYTTGKVPFHHVALHGLVLDPLGKKMSKSKGNVVSPMEIVNQYGSDAARLALVYGTAFGHDQALSHPKLQAMRNFTNKLWNIGRFLIDFKPEGTKSLGADEIPTGINEDDKKILTDLNSTIQKVTEGIDQYRFHDASEALYEFIWHNFADIYIEKAKFRREETQPILEYVFKTSLELLHPFMPFITEELWQKLPHQGKSIMIAAWPTTQS